MKMAKASAWIQIVLLSGVFHIPYASAAPAPAKEAAGQVVLLKGQADRVSKIGVRNPLQIGSIVFAGDRILTADKSVIKIILKEKSELNLGPSSNLIVSSMNKNEPPQLSLISGQVRTKVEKSTTGKVKLFI